MILKSIPETAPRVNATIDGKIMFNNSKFECILLTLQPGEAIPEHTNPFDVLFIGLEGKSIFESEDKYFEIEPCQTLFMPAGLPRSMKNINSCMIKVMVIKLF